MDLESKDRSGKRVWFGDDNNEGGDGDTGDGVNQRIPMSNEKDVAKRIAVWTKRVMVILSGIFGPCVPLRSMYTCRYAQQSTVRACSWFCIFAQNMLKPKTS